MKTGTRIVTVLLSPFVLALIPAFVFFIILPPSSSKYNLSVEAGGSNKYEFCYADLDSDSVSELISIGRITPFWHVLVQTGDHGVHDQWNLKDSLDVYLNGMFFGNFDHDRYSEIYIFTHSGDSLFLNVNEFFDRTGLRSERFYVTRISVLHGGVSTMVQPVGFSDADGDGFDELYFGLGTGFGLEPRRQCYIDLVRKEVKSSSFTGVIPVNAKMADADGDRKPEIFGHIAASGNYRTKVPYSDSSAWLMVFNEKLEFEFPPVEFRGFANYIWVNAYKEDSSRYYLVNSIRGGADTTVTESRIMLFSANGDLVKYRPNSDFDDSPDLKLFVVRHKEIDRIYLYNDRFAELNSDLEELRTVDLDFNSYAYPFTVDINADGEDEFILFSKDEGKLAVYSAGLEKYCEADFAAGDTDLRFSHFYGGSAGHKLFAVSAGKGYFLELNRNNSFYLSYLLFPGIYFMFLIFIFSIRKITASQIEQRERLKRRLLTLQLQSIKSQLDPHFTFNALNSVASLVYMDDRKAAYDSLNKFTNLIRRLLNDAERIYRTLEEELEFVRLYLDLERLRFGDRLNYSIVCDESLTGNEQVPKMVLQTFAENAVKHGITARPSGGSLLIEVRRDDNFMVITVQDDGIGRMQASGHSSSTGRGLKLTDEFYDILNKMSNRQIRHTITDLTDPDGNPAGTKVEVWIPLAEKPVEEAL